MPAIHLIITGHVHGVFFRAETKKFAVQLGLSGWVKNGENGSVEVHAEGPVEKLRELEAWCRRGPPDAAVKNVIVKSASEENCESFVIKH